ncbi:MAG: PilZ domain-containing protein [Candidatus Scalindua sp.]|nr:PilZ domain-containing protein [Candidatus Scalindua sp.]MCR4343941.1 PilZ domain-containing protein [Candidatus Scalindua sp.]
MLAKVTFPNRRRRQRLNGGFEISVSDKVKGRTKDVSANGAFFEVITDDIDAFLPGTIIPLEITTTNITLDSKIRKLRLSGKGLIISREVIEESTGCGIRLNIAVQFKEKLNFWVPSNN